MGILLSLEDNAQILSDFGLTQVQAKIYLTVVRLSLATAGQISKASQVRREDVYRAIPKLEKLGLIQKALGTPLRLRATPIEDALAILIKREQDLANHKVSTLTAKKDHFLKSFKRHRLKLVLDDEPQFIMLSQKDVIQLRTVTMIKEAEKEMCVMASREAAIRFISAYSEQVESALKTGASIRVITEMPEYQDLLFNLMARDQAPDASRRLRCIQQLPCQCIICDNQQALIATSRDSIWEENHCLWTSNPNLVELLQRNFEDSWLASVSIESIETEAVGGKVAEFVKELKPNSHVIFVYDSVDAKHKVLFNFLKGGLDKGEAAVYVTTEETPNQIRAGMRRVGINVNIHEKTGALRILRYNDLYIVKGKFNLSTLMRFWNDTYSQSLTAGFKGLRVTGEMSCFFKHNLLGELVEYESALHRTLELPMTAICAYNSKLLSQTSNPINLYSELIKAHGIALFTGIDEEIGKIELRKA